MTWDEIKNYVDKLPLPDEIKATRSASVKWEGKDSLGHSLQKYIFPVYQQYQIEVEYQWAVCPICKTKKWKKFIAWNDKINMCYERKI